MVFGHMPDGAPVTAHRIAGGGLAAEFLTYGAVLRDLRLEGHPAPLVLGFEGFDDYLTKSRYFGATAGRYANRIRDGRVKIDGVAYQLDTNFRGRHLLHGGGQAMGKQLWQVVDQGQDRLMLRYVARDGEMGFPGTLEVTQTFSLLPGGVLDIDIRAETDAPTLCNIAHHSYYNLSGAPRIADHRLWIAAEHYLPVTDDLIPTGEEAPVAGTRFDFRAPVQIGPQSAQGLIDHNFCLSRERVGLRHVATLDSPASGVAMKVKTTEPGLQVFDGSALDLETRGLDGQSLGPLSGIALEPQVWPDAPHHPSFPKALLRPGEIYHQHTQFIFSKDAT